VTPFRGGGWHPDDSKKLTAEFYKGYWRNDHLKAGWERVGVVTMTKKVISY